MRMSSPWRCATCGSAPARPGRFMLLSGAVASCAGVLAAWVGEGATVSVFRAGHSEKGL